jgi:hypothetical protein
MGWVRVGMEISICSDRYHLWIHFIVPHAFGAIIKREETFAMQVENKRPGPPFRFLNCWHSTCLAELSNKKNPGKSRAFKALRNSNSL